MGSSDKELYDMRSKKLIGILIMPFIILLGVLMIYIAKENQSIFEFLIGIFLIVLFGIFFGYRLLLI